ncbi:MAG: hypothetical protein ABW092_01745 [Candidatus Thiodiazotropha sp.]
MERARLGAAPARWTYRPAQIEIPNHYVYRPLKVKPTRHTADRQRVRPPTEPVIEPYGVKQWDPMPYGYHPMGTPMPYSALPSYDPYLYTPRDNRYTAYRPSERYYYGNRHSSRYPSPRVYSSPRYTGYMPINRHRYRPITRPVTGRYPYPVRPAWIASSPYPAPNDPWRSPAWSYPNTMTPAWQPAMGMPYPGMQQAMRHPGMANPYGINWYDGRGDGEGAWYKLAGQQEWPRVSQYSPMY